MAASTSSSPREPPRASKQSSILIQKLLICGGGDPAKLPPVEDSDSEHHPANSTGNTSFSSNVSDELVKLELQELEDEQDGSPVYVLYEKKPPAEKHQQHKTTPFVKPNSADQFNPLSKMTKSRVKYFYQFIVSGTIKIHVFSGKTKIQNLSADVVNPTIWRFLGVFQFSVAPIVL